MKTVLSKSLPFHLRKTGENTKYLDTSFGVCGVLFQVFLTIFKGSLLKSSEVLLGALNYAVFYIVKYSHIESVISPSNGNFIILEDWTNPVVKIEYFKLLGYGLFHQKMEIRIGALRLFRYLIRTRSDVQCFIDCNLILLTVRSIDISIDNHHERFHAVRLVRKILHVSPDLFPICMARCLISVCRDGSKERDKLLRASQAVINELAVLNPKVFVECGAVSSCLYNALDCSLPRVNEALLSSILFLLNSPIWRRYCSQFHIIMAPFSDSHFNVSGNLDQDFTKKEERELKLQSSCYALLTTFRSWSGFITLYQPGDKAIFTLIQFLMIPDEESRLVIIDFFYDLFGIQSNESYEGFLLALSSRSEIRPPAADAWSLLEGFVEGEGRSILPHISKYRPDLIQNYFSLLQYVLMKNKLLNALCEVIVTSSDTLSIKSTILLGEFLHLMSLNIPNHESIEESLSILTEKSVGKNRTERLRATEAINCLFNLFRIKNFGKKEESMSLYLRNILSLDFDGESSVNNEKVEVSLSKWLTDKAREEVVTTAIKNSRILDSNSEWNWNHIIPIFRWPSPNLISLSSTSMHTVVHRLIKYFKPSSKQFSRVDIKSSTAIFQAQTLIVFLQFLLRLSEAHKRKYLYEFLNDLKSEISRVACKLPYHDSCMSPSHLNMTVCQYYFLAIGSLSKSSEGCSALQTSGIFDQMLLVAEISASDIYSKIFSSTLDFNTDGMNRKIMTYILTSSNDNVRMYATRMLRVFARARARGFDQWGCEMLIAQLYDQSKLIALEALSVLDEVLDHEHYMVEILKKPPSLDHLGEHGQLIVAKLVGSKLGFQKFYDTNFINKLLDEWDASFNLKYVKLMETAISESLTHLQRGEDGLYGRRTGGKHVCHQVLVLPHMYGALTQHPRGFELVSQHCGVRRALQILNKCDTSSSQEIYKLKAAIWSLAHFGTSKNGVDFLSSENVFHILIDIAGSNRVYSVRGTVFNALCLLASTSAGVSELENSGWACVKRNHHEGDQILPHCFKCEKNAENDKHNQGYVEDTFSLDDSGVASLRIKSQTLPHNAKLFSYINHQRSFSDCVEIAENSSTVSNSSNSFRRRTSKLRRRILSSFRKKSRRRDSSSSTSSASEKLSSLFGRLKRRSSSTEDKTSSDENIFRHSEENVAQNYTPRSGRLSPIPSGTSLSRLDSKQLEPAAYSYEENKSNPSITMSPSRYQSPLFQFGFKKGLFKGSQYRTCSESSHDEFQSKSSLRDFHYASFEPNPIHAKLSGLVQSSSVCSEVSSTRSYVYSSKAAPTNNRRKCKYSDRSNLTCDSLENGSSGCQYMGLALPIDLDTLLLDASVDDSIDPNPNFLSVDSIEDIEHANNNKESEIKKKNVFKFHNRSNCLSCMFRNEDEVPSTVTPSHDNTESGDEKLAMRREVIRFVKNMATPFIAKGTELGLLTLKIQAPSCFQDVCLYTEVFEMISSGPYKLNARRFIQELFIDIQFKDMHEHVESIFESKEELYKDLDTKFLYDKLQCGNETGLTTVPNYEEDEFEGFDM